jgi:lambda family phage minor tail protein L
MSIQSEIQKLEPSAIIELFVLDTIDLGGTIYYFHSGTNEVTQNITWQGLEYVRFPIQVTGFQFTGAGQIPRPKVQVSNFMSSITTLLQDYDDLLGAKFTRKRTLKKFLDAVNFDGGVNPTADPTASFPDDVYYIDRKASESRLGVEFELSASFDLMGVQLPRRQIVQNVCPWVYRGAECGYNGSNYFTTSDAPTADSTKDVCGKRLTSCKLRFVGAQNLPFGGFPGADLYR